MEKPERTITCGTTDSINVSSSEDLLVNIFSRLHVKAFCRFKCDCKHWNTLISDPRLVSSHQARTDPNLPKVLCVEPHDDLISLCSIEEKKEKIVNKALIQPYYPDSVLHEDGIALKDNIKLRGSPCNGLICLVAGTDTLVCNPGYPATRHVMVIPRGNERKCFVEGLGFCSSSNKFKVVRLFGRP